MAKIVITVVFYVAILSTTRFNIASVRVLQNPQRVYLNNQYVNVFREKYF